MIFICFVKKRSSKPFLDTLNNFHESIKITLEEEKDRKSQFLDALLVRKNHYIVTTVYRKKTNTNIYLNWNSFGPNSWRCVTVRKLLIENLRYVNNMFLKEETKYAMVVFYYQINCRLLPLSNQLPSFTIINKKINKVKEKTKLTNVSDDESSNKKHQLVLPKKGDKRTQILRLMEEYVRKLPSKKSAL